ncbi:GDSL-like Lipase/Acylhydrolase family [Rhodospirillales bacterium URHD0017]|nr:GDSL-like Lipase/Acylhydrolase family [Rhodospirillales bacterium URHD0017]
MWSGLGLSAVAVLFCLLAGEVAIRIFHPSASLWHYPNFIALNAAPRPDQARGLLRYDSDLGYAPIPGASGVLMHQPISYSADGLRNQNLARARPVGRSILAVGDSYTEGYAVKDDESWPAYLERDLDRPVLNAGVRAYGIDQMVLRAERLAARFKPEAIVLAFISADITRAGMSVLESFRRPYFVPVGDGLELRNVPVPTTPVIGAKAFPRRVLGYSYLLDFTMRRLNARELWYGDFERTGVDVNLVSCRLMHRFAEVVRKEATRGLIVAFPQYDTWTDPPASAWHRTRVLGVLACARDAGLATLDTYDGFAKAGVAGNVDGFYVDWHLNAQGNALAARLIAATLDAGRPRSPP